MMLFAFGEHANPAGAASIVDRFPAEWLATVTLIRGGGRDARGNPLPSTELELEGCLLAARSTSEPVDRSDLTEAKGVLYRRRTFTFLSTDRVRVPQGSLLSAGVWAVDGEPSTWPAGVEVPLRKES